MDIQRNTNGFVLKKQKKSKKPIRIPKFAYVYSKTKKRVKEPNVLKRIKSLRIPPGYSNVIISSKKNSKVQAIGEDEKGRKQYVYSKQHIETQEKVKFKDLIIFGNNVEKIRKDVSNLILAASKIWNNELNWETILAIVLFLIDNCHFLWMKKYKK